MKLHNVFENVRWAVQDKIEHAKGWNKNDQQSGKYTLMMVDIRALFANTNSDQKLDVLDGGGGENEIQGRVPRAIKHWRKGGHMNPSTIGYNKYHKTIDFEDGRHRLVAAYKRGETTAPVLVPNGDVETVKQLTGAEEMKVNETFGFEEVPIPHRKVGQQWREGRPNSEKVKKRPAKNLWFKDKALWQQDLDLEHGGNYTMVGSENEETLVACNKDKTFAHGFWDSKKNKGITYKKPRPMHMAVHPKATFKDYLTK